MTRDSLGDQPEIDDTIEALRRRVAAAPQNIDALVELSDALCERLDNDQTHTPVADDVGEPIELLSTAAELATDADPAWRAALLADLGHKLTWRFEILLKDDPSQEDRLDKQLGEAIRCYQQALECVSAADLATWFFSACPEAVLALCQLLRLRSAAHGNLDDLSAAIAYQEQVLAVLPDDDEDRPAVLYGLGLDYATRHDQNSETAAQDMDHAIGCLRQSRSLIGADHPGRPELAVRLGHMLGYRILAKLSESSDEDFAEAVAELTLARQALTDTTDPSDAISVRMRLGLVRACRYLMRGGDSEDREVARAELNDVLVGWNLPTNQADLCHLTLAQLEAFRALPVQLRRNPAHLVADGTWFRTAVAHFDLVSAELPHGTRSGARSPSRSTAGRPAAPTNPGNSARGCGPVTC